MGHIGSCRCPWQNSSSKLFHLYNNSIDDMQSYNWHCITFVNCISRDSCERMRGRQRETESEKRREKRMKEKSIFDVAIPMKIAKACKTFV